MSLGAGMQGAVDLHTGALSMKVSIVGTRGVPARHGGFETFAEQLSLYLVARGHEAIVYCQGTADEPFYEDEWCGVKRVHIPAPDGPRGTISFDLQSVWHSASTDGVVLTLGYNTAIFSLVYRLKGVPHVMNMDGIEWKRDKWSPTQRAWLWANEFLGAQLANHLIADHPEIKNHLSRHTRQEKITVIPYGEETLLSMTETGPESLGLKAGRYFLVIARPEPENSILEIVRAYSSKTRSMPLVILGRYDWEGNDFHKQVLAAAGAGVIFPGAIYDRDVVSSLRYHAAAYIHGHRVGGTNPSLVESMAAGSAVIAHDNRFSRWVAGPDARYFTDAASLGMILDDIVSDPSALALMRAGIGQRQAELFEKYEILGRYESLLLNHDRQRIHVATTHPQVHAQARRERKFPEVPDLLAGGGLTTSTR
jgi:glycosyltransferase involved in cell wall biosynthesis